MYYLINTLENKVIANEKTLKELISNHIKYNIVQLGGSWFIQDIKLQNRCFMTINHSYSKEFTQEEVQNEVYKFICNRIQSEYVPNIRLLKQL